MDSRTANSRIRLRVKDRSLTRDKIIETVFLTTEFPFIRIFGNFPVYTALCSERDASRVLKSEIKEKLQRKGIEVQTPKKNSIFKKIGQTRREA